MVLHLSIPSLDRKVGSNNLAWLVPFQCANIWQEHSWYNPLAESGAQTILEPMFAPQGDPWRYFPICPWPRVWDSQLNRHGLEPYQEVPYQQCRQVPPCSTLLQIWGPGPCSWPSRTWFSSYPIVAQLDEPAMGPKSPGAPVGSIVLCVELLWQGFQSSRRGWKRGLSPLYRWKESMAQVGWVQE